MSYLLYVSDTLARGSAFLGLLLLYLQNPLILWVSYFWQVLLFLDQRQLGIIKLSKLSQ